MKYPWLTEIQWWPLLGAYISSQPDRDLLVESDGTPPLRCCIVHSHLNRMVSPSKRHIHLCTAEDIHLQQGKGSLWSHRVEAMHTSHWADHWGHWCFSMVWWCVHSKPVQCHPTHPVKKNIQNTIRKNCTYIYTYIVQKNYVSTILLFVSLLPQSFSLLSPPPSILPVSFLLPLSLSHTHTH